MIEWSVEWSGTRKWVHALTVCSQASPCHHNGPGPPQTKKQRVSTEKTRLPSVAGLMDESMNVRHAVLRRIRQNNLYPHAQALKLKSFKTCVRKSYIDKTTRTSEQVIKLIQPNNKTPKEDLG
jgi:hypothetical protein